jgi:hypothetical protein
LFEDVDTGAAAAATPSAPAARRQRRNVEGFGAPRNLSYTFEAEALLLQEAAVFHEEQDGLEQVVPEIEVEFEFEGGLQLTYSLFHDNGYYVVEEPTDTEDNEEYENSDYE